DGRVGMFAKDSSPACTTVPMCRLVSPTQLNSGGSSDWWPSGRRETSGAGVATLDGGVQSARRRFRGLEVIVSSGASNTSAWMLVARRSPCLKEAPRAGQRLANNVPDLGWI